MTQCNNCRIDTVMNDGHPRCVCYFANTLSPRGWCCGALGDSGACGDPDAPGYVLCKDVRGSPECLAAACNEFEETLRIIVPKFPDKFNKKNVPAWIVRLNKHTLETILSKFAWCVGMEGEE